MTERYGMIPDRSPELLSAYMESEALRKQLAAAEGQLFETKLKLNHAIASASETDIEWRRQGKELAQAKERLAAAEARILEQDAAAASDAVSWFNHRKELTQRLALTEAAMKAVASLAGKDWLIGQLALAEALDGKGGRHLQYALIQYQRAKEEEESE